MNIQYHFVKKKSVFVIINKIILYESLSYYHLTNVMNLSISHLLLVFVFIESCRSQSKIVPLYISGGTSTDSPIDIFHQIFHEQKAELLSIGHGWTEGPVIIPKDPPNVVNEILYFSDTIQDKIWVYEESAFEPHHRFTVAIEKSGSCESVRSDCDQVAEPGSNGLAFDPINYNLLICQHGSRSVIKLPLDPANGRPLASGLEVSHMSNFYFFDRLFIVARCQMDYY